MEPKIENLDINQEVNGQGVQLAFFFIGSEKIDTGIRSKQEIGLILDQLRENFLISEEAKARLCDKARNFCILTNVEKPKPGYNPAERIQMVYRALKANRNLANIDKKQKAAP
jgi:hypothetical protein